jgi:non-specific serine/threonine protein kinase
LTEPYHNKALPNGTILREWRLEQVLGVGGFGIVYRGRGIYFDELVAIKEYFPSAISDRLSGATVAPTDSSAEEIYKLGLQKFVEEAKVLWNLSKPTRHPNIVSVRSLFEIHGTAYMVMDFESGVSLSQMLRNGRRFDEKSLLDIVRPVAEGLDRAHSNGVLHRDIKPANILVDEAGRPVLIDFGSARFESGQATSTKVTFYTPPYAAIEQYVKTYPQGPWTDIYALGVVLYQCATGIKPPEVLERLHGGLDEPLSAQPRPGFSECFTRAVDTAMGIRPSERPQSIPEWLKLFENQPIVIESEATRIATLVPLPDTVSGDEKQLHQDESTAKAADSILKPGGARSRKQIIAAAAAAAAVAVIGVATVAFWPSRQDATPNPAPAAQTAPPSEQAPTQTAQDQLPASFETTLDAVIAKAREIGRPDSEIGKLADYNKKITALASQARSTSSSPDAATKLPAILADFNRAAAEAAHSEADALARGAAPQWKDVQDLNDLSGTTPSATAVNAAREAKKKLDLALIAVSAAKDAAASASAATAALGAYASFTGAYGVAVAAYISDKKLQFATQDASLRQLAQRVVTLAGASKPWIFASRARKDAYQKLQDNAAQASQQVNRLDELSRGMSAASGISEVHAGVLQTSDVENTLSGLLASSSTASNQLNQ